jgi:hypothetical protein
MDWSHLRMRQPKRHGAGSGDDGGLDGAGARVVDVGNDGTLPMGATGAVAGATGAGRIVETTIGATTGRGKG